VSSFQGRLTWLICILTTFPNMAIGSCSQAIRAWIFRNFVNYRMALSFFFVLSNPLYLVFFVTWFIKGKKLLLVDISGLCLRQSLQCKNDQRQWLQNKVRQGLVSFAKHIYSMRSIYLQSYFLIPPAISELCPGQSSKSKNKQRAMNRKLGKAKIQFFFIACLSNKIYLPTQFLVDISYSLRVMPWSHSICKNEQRAITPELDKSLHFYTMRSIYLQFLVDTSCGFRVNCYILFFFSFLFCQQRKQL
jgi:hypothetical protein